MVKIKRVYEPKTRDDGYRVLVDRLWPRGIKKENLKFKEWLKELAPTTELRKSFNHDPQKFKDFSTQYRKELKNPTAQKAITALTQKSKTQTITLLYAAHDQKINHATILKKELEKATKPSPRKPKKKPVQRKIS